MFRAVCRQGKNLQQFKRNARSLSLTLSSSKDGDKKYNVNEEKTIKLDTNPSTGGLKQGPATSIRNRKKVHLNIFQGLIRNTDKMKYDRTRFLQKNSVDKRQELSIKLKSEEGEEFLFQSSKKVSELRGLVNSTVGEVSLTTKEKFIDIITEVESQKNVKLQRESAEDVDEQYKLSGEIQHRNLSLEEDVVAGNSTRSQETSSPQLGQLIEDIKQTADNVDIPKLLISLMINELHKDLPSSDNLNHLMAAVYKSISPVANVYSKEEERENEIMPSEEAFQSLIRDIHELEEHMDMDNSNGNIEDEDNMILDQNWIDELDLPIDYIPLDSSEELMLNIDKWDIPIDNEEHMVTEEENSVFLGFLLEQFPKRKEVHKFMELLIAGLQENTHLTVDQKKRIVTWYKELF